MTCNLTQAETDACSSSEEGAAYHFLVDIATKDMEDLFGQKIFGVLLDMG